MRAANRRENDFLEYYFVGRADLTDLSDSRSAFPTAFILDSASQSQDSRVVQAYSGQANVLRWQSRADAYSQDGIAHRAADPLNREPEAIRRRHLGGNPTA